MKATPPPGEKNYLAFSASASEISSSPLHGLYACDVTAIHRYQCSAKKWTAA